MCNISLCLLVIQTVSQFSGIFQGSWPYECGQTYILTYCSFYSCSCSNFPIWALQYLTHVNLPVPVSTLLALFESFKWKMVFRDLSMGTLGVPCYWVTHCSQVFLANFLFYSSLPLYSLFKLITHFHLHFWMREKVLFITSDTSIHT